MHVFQDLALEDECLTTGPMVLAALAWAPDDVEVRREWLGCESLGEAIWSDLGDLYPYLGKRWVCPLIFQITGFPMGFATSFLFRLRS